MIDMPIKIICPYCGYPDNEEYVTSEDDEVKLSKCKKCGKHFVVGLSVFVTAKVRKICGEDEHPI